MGYYKQKNSVLYAGRRDAWAALLFAGMFSSVCCCKTGKEMIEYFYGFLSRPFTGTNTLYNFIVFVNHSIETNIYNMDIKTAALAAG
jgi:hypothetical protein